MIGAWMRAGRFGRVALVACLGLVGVSSMAKAQGLEGEARALMARVAPVINQPFVMNEALPMLPFSGMVEWERTTPEGVQRVWSYADVLLDTTTGTVMGEFYAWEGDNLGGLVDNAVTFEGYVSQVDPDFRVWAQAPEARVGRPTQSTRFGARLEAEMFGIGPFAATGVVAATITTQTGRRDRMTGRMVLEVLR